MLYFDLFVSFCYLMEGSIKADSSGMDTHNYHVLHIVKAHCKSALRCCHFSFDGGRRYDPGIITMSLYKYPGKKTVYNYRFERGESAEYSVSLSPMPSLLNPLPMLGKHTSVRYHQRYPMFFLNRILQVIYATLIGAQSFWVAVKVFFSPWHYLFR